MYPQRSPIFRDNRQNPYSPTLNSQINNYQNYQNQNQNLSITLQKEIEKANLLNLLNNLSLESYTNNINSINNIQNNNLSLAKNLYGLNPNQNNFINNNIK